VTDLTTTLYFMKNQLFGLALLFVCLTSTKAIGQEKAAGFANIIPAVEKPVLAVATKGTNYTIKGNIKGLTSKMMFMYLEDASAPRGFRFDTIMVDNGKFEYHGSVQAPQMLTLNPNMPDQLQKSVKTGGFLPTKSAMLMFLAAPGANINFEGRITDFVDAYPSGNAANDDLARLNRTVFPLMNASVNLNLGIYNLPKADSVAAQFHREASKQIYETEIKAKKDFVKNNPQSLVSAWMLQDLLLRSQIEADSAIILFDQLENPAFAGADFYDELKLRITGIKTTGIGSKAPSIATSNTYDGKAFELANLKGKYVVLDFWGTWCGPCMAGMPDMKKLNEQYKSKLAIVGIAKESNDNPAKWKSTIENDALNWQHIINKKDEDYVSRYNVQGFPTKIIISPEGKILGRFVGEGEEFYTELNKLLK